MNSKIDSSKSSGAFHQRGCEDSAVVASAAIIAANAKHLAQSLDCTGRTSTLRDSFRASFSVGEGHSLSTPLNILVSDWKEKKINDEEEEEEAVQIFPFVQPFIKKKTTN